MKNTIRTFIAIKITPDDKILDFIENAKGDFSEEKMKWVNSNNLHLTLRFLGETTKDQVLQINNALDELVKHIEKFSINFNGIDCFKNQGKPKVLFVNIFDEKDNLINMVQMIDEVVGKVGIETKGSRFYPHLTLARIKFLNNRERFMGKIDEWKDVGFQPQAVNEIIFYQSILNEKEPIYKPLGKYKLI